MRNLTPLLLAAALLGAPAAADAAQTFGSDLQLSAGPELKCPLTGMTCAPTTVAAAFYDPPNAHPFGSPVQGVVVRLRAKASVRSQPLTFRILRKAPGNDYLMALATGPTVTPSGGQTVDEYPVRLRVRKGDSLGVDGTAMAIYAERPASGTWYAFQPPLADLAPGRTQTANGRLALLINADVEPDRDNDGYGDETQDPDPARRSVPEAGARPLPKRACDDSRTGTPGNDRLQGSPLGTRIESFAGNDQVSAQNADDCLFTGDGDDTALSNGGNDLVDTGAGRDFVNAGPGPDEVRSGAGNDRVSAGDFPSESPGAPPIKQGFDRISTGAGNDQIAGDPSRGRFDGGSGRDTIRGGTGAETLIGGSGDDVIRAADGRRDTIRCGSGRDTVTADRKDRLSGCERVAYRRG